MDSAGQTATRLTEGSGVTEDLARWSPDGSRIAFQIARDENYDVGVVRFSDRRVTQVADSSAYDGMYAGSPDGRQVAFICDRDGFEGLYTVGTDRRNIRRLTGTRSLNPDWRPNQNP